MVEFILAFVISYVWHALGITVGYHRLLSHRTFSCPKWVEYFFVLGGYFAFEGSPIWWTTVHRAHHRYADTPLDPHAPKFGIYNAHHGWILHDGYPASFSPERHTKDLIDDPLYKVLEQGGDWRKTFRFCLWSGVAFRGLVWLLFGWQAALGSLLAGLIVLQIPLILNVVCHIPKLGYTNYKVKDDSVNVWWVALLSMGEGWHNNHHASPGSAKTGMKPWELDISWLVIKSLRFVGLASKVKYQTDKELVARFNEKSANQPRTIEVRAKSDGYLEQRRAS